MSDMCYAVKPVSIGFGNVVMSNRVIAVISPESSPIKRLVSEYREKGGLIDATYGRRTRAVIIMDNGSCVLSSLMPDTIASRIAKEPGFSKTGEEPDPEVENE